MTRRSAIERAAARLGAAALSLPLAAFGGIDRLFAPAKSPWPRWSAHDPASTAAVDHGPWTRFLRRYRSVDAAGVARVAYAKVSAEDRAALAAYLDALDAVDVDRLARPEQMAFWLNLYNARTVALVVERYPVGSIKEIRIGTGPLARTAWSARLATVHGVALSLDDVEHRILRPLWGDPRVHYALNCAAVGCPNLQAEAFARADLDAALDRAARGFVNDRRGVEIIGGGVVVSSIYSWFAPDFGGTEEAVLAHIRRYAEPPLRDRLLGASIVADRYDWSLNDAAAA